ncbi:MAG: hypothetical protein H7A35_00385 [Planctomycetales bacterium]|nr:hypothetical protein [bacterium]UNM08520.1 MAG: hypothetical protein H7A35_00385 [Planctomycetales bacterium]
MGRLLPTGLAGLLLFAGMGCTGGPAPSVTGNETFATGEGSAGVDGTALHERLTAEFERLGVDPQRSASSPPQGDGNAVFDLSAQPYDPDGPDGPEPTHIRLEWTERLLGDYDQNGEVLASDLAALAQNFGGRVSYRSTSGTGEPGYYPEGSVSSYNWRMARIDGDASGEIGLSDLTVIAQHFGESIDGYRVYRLGPGSIVYYMMPHPQDPSLPFSIGRYESGGGGKQVVRYSFEDIALEAGTYRYFVVPYDIESGEEGRASLAFANGL